MRLVEPGVIVDPELRVMLWPVGPGLAGLNRVTQILRDARPDIEWIRKNVPCRTSRETRRQPGNARGNPSAVTGVSVAEVPR